MKVLQILPEMNAGGVERGTLEIGRFLVERGHSALVVSNGGRLVPQLEAAGVRHLAMPVHRKSLWSFLQIRPFRALLETEAPDILHIRSRVPGWIAWLAWRKLPSHNRSGFVSTVHGFYSANAYSAIMARGERVIAVSHCIRDYIITNYQSTPHERMRVIPRGIDLRELTRGYQPDAAWLAAWRRDFPQLAGKRLLTLPGRITRLKGHEDLLQLVGALLREGVPAHGLIVGDVHARKREYLAELQARVSELGLAQHVTFTGHRSDIREILSVSDVVLSLSTQPEAFGRTVLEAVALGRPVVAYNQGGVGEQLSRVFTAGQVPPGDQAALLQTTQRILRESLQPGSVPEDYTLPAMCAATLQTYQELLPH